VEARHKPPASAVGYLTALMQEYDAEEKPYRAALHAALRAARASGRYDALQAAWDAWRSIWPAKYHPRLVAALAADPSLYGVVLAELQSGVACDTGTCRAVNEEMITLHPELLKAVENSPEEAPPAASPSRCIVGEGVRAQVTVCTAGLAANSKR
jgi:hypothetical protein